MKYLLTIISCLICIQLSACRNKINEGFSIRNEGLNRDSMTMKITIGKDVFTATLYNNPAATAFKNMLPISVKMIDLNANEKYSDLPDDLPVKTSNPGTIKSGDLMIYGANTLVLFYKSFSTSFSYTPLGRIKDPSGLAAAVGSGNVTVTFTLEI